MNVSSLGRDVDKLTLYVTQLFQNFTVNGESRNIIGSSLENVMPLHIGLPIIVGVMLFVYVLVSKKRGKAKEKLLLVLMTFEIFAGWQQLIYFHGDLLFPFR